MPHGKSKRADCREHNLRSMLSKKPATSDELSCVQWKECQWIHRIHGGEHSSGVFLVQIGEGVQGRLLIVKPGSAYTAGELFCAQLFNKFGIHTPAQRVICDVHELNEVRAAMRGEHGCQFIDADEAPLVAKWMAKPLCAVSEYCPSMKLDQLGLLMPPRAPSTHPSSAFAGFLSQLGVVMAADVLTNNGDRCPSLTRDRKHHGNPGNILIAAVESSSSGGGGGGGSGGSGGGDRARTKPPPLPSSFACCAVDNMVVGINFVDGRERYLTCVRELVAELYNPGIAAKDIHFIRTAAAFLEANAGGSVSVQSTECEVLRQGVCDGMARIVDEFRANPLLFGEIKTAVARSLRLKMKVSTKGISAANPERAFDLGWQGYELIHVNFIRQVATAIAEGAAEGLGRWASVADHAPSRPSEAQAAHIA
jgi:hypothetical protein